MMVTIIRIGNQYRVNSTTTGNQLDSSVTNLANGDYVVTWTSTGQDGSGGGIYAQRYSALGVAIGGETLVNPINPFSQGEPSITALTTGGYVVTWTSEGQDSTTTTSSNGQPYPNGGIYQQVFGANGGLIGGETLVNSAVIDNQSQSTVTSLPGGGFVVVWTTSLQSSNGEIVAGIAFQRFAANGTTLGSEVPITLVGPESPYFTMPTITTLSNGDFVVVWAAGAHNGGNTDIFSQRFNASGVAYPSGVTQVNTSFVNFDTNPFVTELAGGGYVVHWTRDVGNGLQPGYQMQFFGNNGVAQGGQQFQLTYGTPQTIVGLTDGGYVIITYDGPNVFAQFPERLYAQKYNALGVAVGDLFLIAEGPGISDPDVSALPNNGFVVTWTAANLDGSGDGVYSRTFYSPTPGSDLEAGIEYADGTTANDIFNVGFAGLNAGDRVLGFAGQDILRFTGGGVNTAVGATLDSIEEIQLTNATGTTLTVNDVAQALLVTTATGAADALILNSGVLTVAQRRTLFDLGVESLSDGQGTFLSTNAAPVVMADTVAAGENASVTINVTQNDSDANGDTMTVVPSSLAVTGFTTAGGLVLPVAGGPAVTNAMLLSHFSPVGGSIQFTGDFDFLDAGQSITVTLTYGVTDGVANVTQSTLTLTINGSNEVIVLSNVADNVSGSAFGDNITANDGDDTIFALSGNDSVYGGTGDDSLYGGDGADKLFGEADDDYLHGGSGNDLVYGGAGEDIVAGGSGDDQLWGGADADLYGGGSGLDYARYDDANWGNLTLRLDNSTLNAGAAAIGDTYSGIEGLVGGLGNDVILGNAAANFLFGGGGADYIDGLAGSDYLNGGAGADRFRFSTTLGSSNVDTVAGFVHGTDDLLLLQSLFSAIGTTLDTSELKFGTAAADANDFIIYNSVTGQLFYDANGNGAGGQTLFATVTAGTVLDTTDFIMA
jgi:Ca2+-binding RTX toxin-like protein